VSDASGVNEIAVIRRHYHLILVSLGVTVPAMAMANAHTVLLLGASNLLYTETDASSTLTALLEAELNGVLADQAWHSEARPLFFGPRMGEMASIYVKTDKPTAVVVNLGEMPFSRDVPIARIKRRWPRLYPLARRLAERSKALAGGNRVRGPRGWLFRFPRWVAIKLIGAEPEIALEDAVTWTLDALDSLVRSEDVIVVCGLSFMPGPTHGAERQVYWRRANSFKSRISGYCQDHHVPIYDRLQELAHAGRQTAFSVDADYGNLATRRFEAGLIRERIASARSPLPDARLS
jgi:hypothetical protein